MARTLAYLRTSTDKQDINHQKVEILEYARRERIHIDDFIAISISSKRERRARRIDELLQKLSEGDTLIVTELSRLGRSTSEVIDLIDGLIQGGV
jgi:DNA invertase Pin-like site-specific DNA recombinase